MSESEPNRAADATRTSAGPRGFTPGQTVDYVYAGGRISSARLSIATPILYQGGGTAAWEFSYTGGGLTSMSSPKVDPLGPRPVTTISYSTDASGLPGSDVRLCGHVLYHDNGPALVYARDAGRERRKPVASS